MLPLHKIVWHEWRARHHQPARIPEPSEAMEDPEQIRAYVKAYEWGGPTTALQLHHLSQLSGLIRPGDTVLDLACGPGPLLLELAALYPNCRFIGADLSRPMLSVLEETSAGRGLSNVETLCDDIRHLASIPDSSIDLVITTSALHHLPDAACLQQVFQRVRSLLKPDGGLYIFDFGLVKSQQTRDLLVADVAKKAPAITAVDYAHSLRAAFPVAQVIELARSELRLPLRVQVSSLVDFFYFIRTGDRTAAPLHVNRYIEDVGKRCGLASRIERMMLETMQRAI
jgi:arsenite methyltransferase